MKHPSRPRPLAIALAIAISSMAPFAVAAPAPSIASISPSSGPSSGGTLITLVGSNFGDSNTVTIGGANAGVTSSSASTIIASTPAGEGLDQPVIVTTGGQSSNTVLFSYKPDGPTITGLTPTHGPTGGGYLLTITGSNFGVNEPSVTVGGTPATGVHFFGPGIRATCSEGEGTNLPVIVTWEGLPPQSSGTFDYDPPVIDVVSPSVGPTTGYEVVISGNNFGLDPSVTIGGIDAPVSSSTHTRIIATVAPGEGGNHLVVVTVAGQQSSETRYINYNPPRINEVSANSFPTSGSIWFTITGQNFSSKNTVTVGGQDVQISSSTQTQIIATLPPGEGINIPVIVTAAGQASTPFSVSYDPPALDSLRPAGGPAAGGSSLTLTGINFGFSPTVTIGGNPAPLISSTHTRIIATSPPGTGSAAEVSVTAATQFSNTRTFNYALPKIDSVSPATAPTTGSAIITLLGSNFLATTTSLTVNGSAIVPDKVTDSVLTFAMPDGEGANLPIVLTASGIASEPAFISYEPPSISSVTPDHGKLRGGTSITLNGQNFGLSPSVSIGGRPAPVYLSKHDGIVCQTPPGSGQDRRLTVTAGGQTSSPALFSYDPETYQDWEPSVNWDGLDSTFAADPKSNGWKNSLAYALGVDPPVTTGGELASRNPPVFGKPSLSLNPEGRLELSFWRRRSETYSDLAYQVLFSDGLGNGAWEASALAPQVEVVDDFWEFCTFTDHAGPAKKRFGRLQIEIQEP